MNTPRAIAAVLAAGSLVVVAGCQQYTAERDGKKLGQAICDLHGADTDEEAQEAMADITEQLDDLGSKFALFTAEDRADIENNLADLAEHRVQGQPNLMYQDLTVLERSADNIREDVNETAQAAWDGVLQGLSECTQ